MDFPTFSGHQIYEPTRPFLASTKSGEVHRKSQCHYAPYLLNEAGTPRQIGNVLKMGTISI